MLVCHYKLCYTSWLYTQLHIEMRRGDFFKPDSVEIVKSKVSKAYHAKFIGVHFIIFAHWILNGKYRSKFTKITQSLFSTNRGNIRSMDEMTLVLHYPGPNEMYQNQGLLRIKA